MKYVAPFLSQLVMAWLAIATIQAAPAADGPGALQSAIELLPPTGKFAIGRRSFHWSDPARAQSGNDKREILAHMWYPATPNASTATASYLPDFEALRAAVGEATLKEAAGPAYDALSKARTHAVADAELCPELDKYPVVLLTHGLRYSAVGYSILAEELASHGYVVVGVDHPATAFSMILPGDRTVIFDEKLWSQRRSAEALRAFERAKVQQCAEDLVFALNQLESLNRGTPEGPFAGRLDLARVGIVGHSFGGRVAARVCQIDARLLACALLDSFGRTMHVETNRGREHPVTAHDDSICSARSKVRHRACAGTAAKRR